MTGSDTEGEGEGEKIPPAVREQVLERDRYACQVCGVSGLQVGGKVALEAHHKQREPEGCGRHDLANLVTLCVDCHSWVHKRPTGEELPFEITDADQRVLLPHDYQILQVLHESGPLTTGEVQEALSLELSTDAIRDRLWLLMGLDKEVVSRDQALVDQDARTNEWGVVGQIEDSKRGRIPDDMQTLIRRVHDERVRQALARGCDRATVADVFDVAERTTWYKQRRAQAYDFPLTAVERGTSSSTDARVPGDAELNARESADAEPGAAAGSELQDPVEVWPPGVDADGGESDAVTEAAAGDGDDGRDDSAGADASLGSSSSSDDDEVASEAAVKARLEQAIDALRAVEEAL